MLAAWFWSFDEVGTNPGWAELRCTSSSVVQMLGTQGPMRPLHPLLFHLISQQVYTMATFPNSFINQKA